MSGTKFKELLTIKNLIFCHFEIENHKMAKIFYFLKDFNMIHIYFIKTIVYYDLKYQILKKLHQTVLEV